MDLFVGYKSRVKYYAETKRQHLTVQIFKDNLLRKLVKIRGYYTVRALKYRHYKNRNLCCRRKPKQEDFADETQKEALLKHRKCILYMKK